MDSHFNECTTPKDCWCEIKRYWLIFGIAIVILIGEIWGGIISGSLALLADAGHVFTDSAAILVSVIIAFLVKKGSDENKTRNIGGVINALLLGFISIWVFIEALERIGNPRDITSWIMISIAIIGTIGNYIQHRVIEVSDEKHITHEAMSLHILSDLAQSGVVVTGGIVIALTGWSIIDPILSFGISLLMGYWSLSLLQKIKSGHYDNHHDHCCHHGH